MSWCWGTTEWGEQEDCTFYLCIPDKENQEIYKEDYAYDVTKGHGEHFGWTLLEDMHSNSEFILTDALNAFQNSVPHSFDIFAYHTKYCGNMDVSVTWRHVYANSSRVNAPTVDVGLYPTQDIIVTQQEDDRGLWTKVDKMWVVPEGWVKDIFDGKTIICHSSPVGADYHRLLNGLLTFHTRVSFDGDGYALHEKHPTDRHYYGWQGLMRGKGDDGFAYLNEHGYIRSWSNHHYCALTEKGLLATGETLYKTFCYQFESKLATLKDEIHKLEDRWGLGYDVSKIEAEINLIKTMLKKAKERENAKQSKSDE